MACWCCWPGGSFVSDHVGHDGIFRKRCTTCHVAQHRWPLSLSHSRKVEAADTRRATLKQNNWRNVLRLSKCLQMPNNNSEADLGATCCESCKAFKRTTATILNRPVVE